MKKLIAGLLLSVASVGAVADSNAGYFLFGAILGSQLRGPTVVYQQAPVYIQQPQIIYQQLPPVIVTPSQYPYYEQNLHGYCAGYQGHQYARGMDNARYQQYGQPRGYPR